MPGAAAALFQQDVTCCRRWPHAASLCCAAAARVNAEELEISAEFSLCNRVSSAGLLPAKLAKFKSKTEFLHQPERVSWTEPTEKLVPGRQSGPLAPHPSPAGPHHQLGPTALDHFIHFPCLKVLDCTQQSWITKEHRLHLNCFKCCQEKRGLGSSPS